VNATNTQRQSPTCVATASTNLPSLLPESAVCCRLCRARDEQIGSGSRPVKMSSLHTFNHSFGGPYVSLCQQPARRFGDVTANQSCTHRDHRAKTEGCAPAHIRRQLVKDMNRSIRHGTLGMAPAAKDGDAREDTSATANLVEPRTNRAIVMSSSAAIPKRNCVAQIVGKRLLFDSSDE
jgi:hypothetical protein